MSPKAVLLFPGQGAYIPGALNSLTRELPELAITFAEVDAVAAAEGLVKVSAAVTGEHSPELERLLLDEPPHILQLTLYASAVGMYRALVERGLKPYALAGHSLGEIAALVCGGAFTVEQGAQIVLHRTAAVGETNPGGVMSALGARVRRVQQILDLIGDANTVVAAENGPRQTVVSGSDATVESVESIARELRISVARLRSPFPFHSPLLAEAAQNLARRLAELRQQPLSRPVYSPILGRYYTDDDRLTHVLAAHLTSPVPFTSALAVLHAAGADTFVEAGVGGALSRLAADTVIDATSIACVDGVGDPTDAFRRSQSALAKLGAIASSAASDVAALLLPDVDEALRRSFWAAHAEDLRTHVRALLRDYRAAQGHPSSSPSVTPQPAAVAPTSPSPDAPPAGEAISREGLLAELSGMYASALEYPVEVFTEDVELEADLGVDSVKQTELLSRAAERYHLPARPADFRLSEYSTIGKVADFVLAALPAPDADVVVEIASFGGRRVDAVPASASGDPVARPVISRGGLLAELSGMYASALEYPVEVFTEDVELEADLGVDSVKQTELLSRAAERYHLPARPADFRLSEYSTIGKVADFVLAALPALAA